MIDEDKLYQAHYQPDRLWADGKAIKELHIITSMLKKRYQTMVSKTSPLASLYSTSKRNALSYYDITIPNKQHQFDLVDMPHDVFEGKTYKYLLCGVDVASRYGVAKPLMTKKSSEVAFVLEEIYKKKKGGVFKYSNDLQIDNGSEFKGEVTKLFEKRNVNIRRATAKYKHTHISFVEVFNKKL